MTTKQFRRIACLCLCAAAIGLQASAAKPAKNSKVTSKTDLQDVNGVLFADPFILLDGDTYYAYGTGSTGIPVYTSKDLKTWKDCGMALVNECSYGDHWFWAPEITKVAPDRYIMYYSAEEHTCVAEAKSPLGPFVSKTKQPVIPGERTIDSSLFIDDNGQAYLYFDRFDKAGYGESVWVAKVNPDLMSIDQDSWRLCLLPCTQPEWEKEGVDEGTYVMKHGDTYYMTFTGNGYFFPGYGVGVATSKSPMGPWVKYEGNPILQFPETEEYGRLEGVGHSAMFTDKNGQLNIVFHAHCKPGKVHPRQMYIAPVNFTDDKLPMMKVDTSKIIKAKMKK